MKKKLDNSIGVILLLFAFVCLFIASRYFWVGYNNTDLVFNYQNIASQINPYLYQVNISFNSIYEAKDNMSSGRGITLNDLYRLGTEQSQIGFTLMFIAGILFYSGISILLMKKERTT